MNTYTAYFSVVAESGDLVTRVFIERGVTIRTRNFKHEPAKVTELAADKFFNETRTRLENAWENRDGVRCTVVARVFNVNTCTTTRYEYTQWV